METSVFARSFYQVIQDLFGENNAVLVLTTRSVSVAALVAEIGDVKSTLLNRARVSPAENLKKIVCSNQSVPHTGTVTRDMEARYSDSWPSRLTIDCCQARTLGDPQEYSGVHRRSASCVSVPQYDNHYRER